MSESIAGKVIVLTGASSGFGRGAALEFARKGAALVLAARSEGALDELASECNASSGQAIVVVTDVSQEADVENLARKAIGEFGHIDIWVNDAGVASVGRFDEVPLSDHLQVIKTDLLGTVTGSWFAMKHFYERGRGTLINVASVIGKIPAPYYASYTASKYGVVGFDASLRQELDLAKAEDIHVCTVLPMAMDTPFFDHASNYTGKLGEPIPPLYDADKVVEAIVGLATRPEKEVIVGAMGKVMAAMHNVMPAAVEKSMGTLTHKAQIQEAEPGPITEGSVHAPAESGAIHSPRLDTRN
jgi:short-subunit dehydrogenase